MIKYAAATIIFSFLFYGGNSQQSAEKSKQALPIKKLDNPKVINQRSNTYWKDGTRSTPTGYQATGIGSGYSAYQPKQKAVIVSPKKYSNYSTKQSTLNSRKIYHWEDGQVATPSGHRATGVANNSYSSLKKEKRTIKEELENKATKQQRFPSSSKLDPRKIYLWPDGQRATPSGHRATPVNGGYSAPVSDSNEKDRPLKKDLRKKYQ